MSEPGVLSWLLTGDPAIRWQVMQDLQGAPTEQVRAMRERVATEGWGARLLAAQDPDGRVARVEFFRDGGAVKLGEDTTSPYSFSWKNPPTGAHVLVARATDDRGAAATSAGVRVTVQR